MAVLKNARHERSAQGVVQGLSADAAYEAAGYKPSRAHAARLATKVNIRARIEELQTQAAANTVHSASELIDGFWRDMRAMAAIRDDPKASAAAKTAAVHARRGIGELLGRHLRAWDPQDGADATADHIPLAERLKHYAREAEQQNAIDRAGDKVVRLSRDQRARDRSAPA